MGAGPRAGQPAVSRLRRLLADVQVIRGDLLDQGSLISAVERVQPDEVYNLGAISFVPMSWQQAELTAEVTGMGVLRMLEAIRVCSGASARRAARAGPDPLLPGFVVGDVRPGQRDAADRDDRRSTRAARTAWPRRTGTSSPRTTASRTGCSRSPASCSTTSRRGGAPSSSPARSRSAWRAIKLGLAADLRLGNLDARRDWGFAGRLRPRHAPDAPGRDAGGLRHRHRADAVGAELVEAAFAAADLDWERPRRHRPRACTARPRSTCCAPTRRRPASSSAGSRRCPSRSWSR